jgi:hypothetical protein
VAEKIKPYVENIVQFCFSNRSRLKGVIPLGFCVGLRHRAWFGVNVDAAIFAVE